jgi:hypothetical protein
VHTVYHLIHLWNLTPQIYALQIIIVSHTHTHHHHHHPFSTSLILTSIFKYTDALCAGLHQHEFLHLDAFRHHQPQYKISQHCFRARFPCRVLGFGALLVSLYCSRLRKFWPPILSRIFHHFLWWWGGDLQNCTVMLLVLVL